MPILPEEPGPVQTKVCTKCGGSKPPADYYVRDKTTGRLMSWCKACHKQITTAAFKRKYAEDPEPFKAAARAYYAANADACKANRKRYLAENRGKVRESERRYRAANHDKVAANKARYRQRHRDVIAAWNIQDYDRNRALKLAKHKAWRQANRERHKAINLKAKHRYRARKAGALGSFTAAEWETVKAAQGYRCLGCGMYEPMIQLTVDHVVPLSRGGTNDPSNLAGLCKPCNSSKQAKAVDYRAMSKVRRRWS